MPDNTAAAPVRRADTTQPVVWTNLHHVLLDAVSKGVITLHRDHYHRVRGHCIGPDADLGLARLLITGLTELAAEPGQDGDLPVLITDLGQRVLERWSSEHPGGAA